MKITINEYGFADAFKNADRDNYSYEGYKALYDYYEEIDEDMELDVIAICCDWTEYTAEELEGDFDHLLTFEGWNEESGEDYDDEEEKHDAYIVALVQELNDHTTIIELSGSYLVLAF